MSLLRDALRRHWAVDVVALVLIAVTTLMAVVADGIAQDVRANQKQADARAARDRRDLCAILATITGNAPPAIVKARRDFARPRHPRDCQPSAVPSPIAAVTASPSPGASSVTSIVLIEPGGTSRPRPQPTVTMTARPTPSRSPSPGPSSTPTCVVPPLCIRAGSGNGPR